MRTLSYDGDSLRVSRTEEGTYPTRYLRSSVLGGQVVAEVEFVGGMWQWWRGYVYMGSQLLAVQQGGVYFVHEDAVTKSKRVTDMAGGVQSAVEVDPYGADTNRSSNAAFQPRKYTTYERDGNGTDEAMLRRYNRWHSRFDQPDPYEGSYDFTDPQSFNRYSYVQGDPVNFTDPLGLDGEPICDASGQCYPWQPPLATVYGRVSGGGSLAALITGMGFGRSSRLPITEFELRGAQKATPQSDPKCDQTVASIFGGEGAVSTASGFEPPNILNGAYRGDTTGDNGQPVYGHLGSRAMHLYGGDPPGTGITGVYLPPGYTALYANPQTLPVYKGGSFVAFYPNLNGLRNVSIIATHVADFTGSSSQRNAAGSIYIGTTGGRGASPSDNPNYIHSHFELVRGRVVRGRSTTKMPHISFNIFCK